jgi:hypothetical protein
VTTEGPGGEASWTAFAITSCRYSYHYKSELDLST